MPVVMSDNPKKISTFMMNGVLYEGTIADYYEGRAKPVGEKKDGNES